MHSKKKRINNVFSIFISIRKGQEYSSRDAFIFFVFFFDCQQLIGFIPFIPIGRVRGNKIRCEDVRFDPIELCGP